MSAGPSGAGLFVGANVAPRTVGPTPPVMAALGAGATVAIPGPAPGFVRLLDRIQAFAEVAATSITVQSVLRDVSLVDWYLGPVSAALGSVPSSLAAGLVPIFPGEELRVTNPSAVAGRLTYVARDIPAAAISPIRLSLTNAAQTLVPAPGAGFYSRLLVASELINTAGAETVRCVFGNADTITHSLAWTIGGTIFTRSGQANANTLATTTIGASLRASVSADPLEIQLLAAVATTAPVFIGAYETLRG